MSKQTKKISSYRKRIDYTSTACLYCWHIWISRIRFTIQMGVFHVMRLFVFFFLPKKYHNRFYRRHIESMKAQDFLFGDIECGDDILTAKDMVKFTYSGYLALPISIVICILCTIIGWYNLFRWKDGMGIIVIIIILLLTIFIGVNRLTNTFDDPHIYLSYFKKFKKQDEVWLKRWKKYTILLLAGAFLSIVMSFGFLFLCVIIYRNIHGPLN